MNIVISNLKPVFFVASTLLLFLFSTHTQADATQPNALETQFNATAIYQHATKSELNNDYNISFDFIGSYSTDQFSLHTHVEGNTTPKTNSVATVLGASNADAGTSLSKTDEGRIQLSQLFASFSAYKGANVHIGLLDSTAFFDTSLITNDENTQFITADFVNNSVIDFPDYALATVLEYGLSDSHQLRAMLSSTDGLADNPSRNYSSLFEVNDDKKGLFSIVESQWQNDVNLVGLGAWLHSGDHEALNNSAKTNLSNYGLYLTAAQKLDNQTLELRMGYANEAVSSAAMFTSLAYQLDLNDWQFAAAYGLTTYSTKLSSPHADTQTLEVYARKQLNKNWSITPSVQYFSQPMLDTNSSGNLGSNFLMGNLRINVIF